MGRAKSRRTAPIHFEAGNVKLTVEGVPGDTSGVDTSGYVLSEGVLSVSDDPGFGMSLTERAYQ